MLNGIGQGSPSLENGKGSDARAAINQNVYKAPNTGRSATPQKLQRPQTGRIQKMTIQPFKFTKRSNSTFQAPQSRMASARSTLHLGPNPQQNPAVASKDHPAISGTGSTSDQVEYLVDIILQKDKQIKNLQDQLNMKNLNQAINPYSSVQVKSIGSNPTRLVGSIREKIGQV